MSGTSDLRDPWLVAVWPGMGSVALLAGTYLVHQLKAERMVDLSVGDLFEMQNVEVENGLATAGRSPRSMVFEWKDPEERRDLVIYIGEAQPMVGARDLCDRLLDYAIARGVRRFFTFAAIATQLQPGMRPHVHAVATDAATLNEATELGVAAMETGQITGLNGLLLAAGAERGLTGLCFLGELPFYAVNMPNPSAAQAVLERFAELAGIDVDFEELERQGRSVERDLQQMLEHLTEAMGEDTLNAEETEATGKQPQQVELDPGVERRIEAMFERARRERSGAMELKRELDRLGVFKQYEDRFLDLFREAR